MKFEWDENKNRENVSKHGVDFEEAAYAFSDPSELSMFDEDHSRQEDRWTMLARSPSSGKVLVVCHTYREIDEADVVRIISARHATKREEATYWKRVKR